jgi:hypothetical protein
MKKSALLFVALIAGALSLKAQVYTGKHTTVSFFSTTPMENITAEDSIATMILNGKTGDVMANINCQGFVFPNALMREHFNENYMETDKEGPKDANGKPTYPNKYASFKGKIQETIDYSKDGSYPVTMVGTLKIHNTSQPATLTGTLIVKGNMVTIDSKFAVKLADYNIEVPSAVGTKIAESIDVTVHCEMISAKK